MQSTQVKKKIATTPTDRQQAGNPYLRMPLDRVRADALYGVTLAREAWRILDPDGANLALGRIVEPAEPSKRRKKFIIR